jgi:hypothetical protein
MSTHESGDHHDHEEVRFEPTDVATRPVVTAVVSLAIFTVVFTVVAHLVYGVLARRERAMSPAPNPLAAEYAAKEPPEPRLQIRPKTDLEMLRASEEKTLGRLAWVDRGAGVVQVPIGRAMEMLLAKGLPARQGPVPFKMQPHGVAPSQMAEGAGAPDWAGTWKIGSGEAAHADEHAAAPASHEPAASGKAATEGHRP